MQRREFITLLGGVTAAWPLVARAQPLGNVYRIGYLGVASHAGYTREIEALLKGLRQLGYEDGKNIAIHYLFAEGDYDRLATLAAELVTSKVDVLLTSPRGHASHLHCSNRRDGCCRLGILRACAEHRPPGGNVTGLTFFFAEISPNGSN